MRAPRGHLDDGHVLVPDQAEANRLYSKGYAGNPQKGGALRLTLIEAAQLVEEGRLAVTQREDSKRDLSFRDLLELAVEQHPGAEIPLFAYRDLRARGYVTRHANQRSLDFLVWRRGEAPPAAQPAWLAGAINERNPLHLKDLLAWLEEAEEENARLVLLIVDEEGDITHYRVKETRPTGNAPGLPDGPLAEGVFLRDRVIVWDEEAAKRLREPRYIGRTIPGGLQLSLVEAYALQQEGVLHCPGLEQRARSVEPDLDLRARCYRDLVAHGLWVKTGYKFGTHFRVYDEHPDGSHAPWIVDAVPPMWETSWPEISRAIRLAHSVRKNYLLSVAEHDRVRHVVLKRFRP